MEQKNELKVYKFEVTRLRKNEDGTVSGERKTLACGYAFEGDPSPRVDYNRYWEFGDGCVSRVSKDGKPVESDVNSEIAWMYDLGFNEVDIHKMVDGLDAPGKWAEVCLGDDAKTTLRVTRLQELPEIDKVWEEFIRARSGAAVHVMVDTAYNSADSVNVKLMVKAPTREELDRALCAVGVLHPQDIEPDVVEGEGGAPTGFAATVVLAAEI